MSLTYFRSGVLIRTRATQIQQCTNTRAGINMGGGASSAAAEQMEEMVAFSSFLGQAVTCMNFPGEEGRSGGGENGVVYCSKACLNKDVIS